MAGRERIIVAVDLGTSGPKVALMGTGGRIYGWELQRVRTLLGEGGAAEQDPEEWFAAIRACLRRLLSRRIVPLRAISGISVTAQWMGTVAVDRYGRPLHNAIIWMDSRGAGQATKVTGGLPTVPGTGYNARKLWTWLRYAGGLPSRTGKDPIGHILWLRDARPDVYRSAATFLDVPDYLNLRLTGRACAAYDTAVGFWCTDNRDLGRVRYHDDLVRMCGIDRSKLPELVPTGTVIGYLTPAAAHDLGLGEHGRHVQVVTATGDTASAAIGAGTVADYDAHLYIGTSSWLSCHVPFKRTDVRTNVTSLPSGIPGKWWVATEQDTAGRALQWAIDVLGVGGSGVDRYQELFTLAATAPPGSGGIVFAPWLNGERTPVDDSSLRGVWFGMDLRTTRAHLARSVLEGVALNTRWMLDAVERFTRRGPGGPAAKLQNGTRPAPGGPGRGPGPVPALGPPGPGHGPGPGPVPALGPGPGPGHGRGPGPVPALGPGPGPAGAPPQRPAKPGRFAHITFVGGGARSPLWCQIIADVLGRPIRQAADPVLANVRGAGFAGAVALGDLRWEDIPQLVRIAATYEPYAPIRSVHDSSYRTLVELYKRNRRTFAGLHTD